MEPNTLIKEEDVGHLLPLKCGHRGKPTRTEEKVIEHLFSISGFLDPHFVPASSSGSDEEEDDRLSRKSLSIGKEAVVHRLDDSSDAPALVAQVSEPADLGDVNLVFEESPRDHSYSLQEKAPQL